MKIESYEEELARTKQAIYNWFDQHREQWQIRCSTDFRIEVHGRWHVPDVTVLPAGPGSIIVCDEGEKGFYAWPDAVPDAVFEVFRPYQFTTFDLAELINRLDDYASQGIEVWLVDSDCRYFFEYTKGSLSEESYFQNGDRMDFKFEEIRTLREQSE